MVLFQLSARFFFKYQPYSEDFCPCYWVSRLAQKFNAKKCTGDFPTQSYGEDIVLVIGFPDWHQNLVPKITRGIILQFFLAIGFSYWHQIFSAKNYVGDYSSNSILRNYRVPTLNSYPNFHHYFLVYIPRY